MKDLIFSTNSPSGLTTTVIHPSDHDRLIVFCQGYGGTLHGDNNRYLKIADSLCQEVGTVVRFKSNATTPEQCRATYPDDVRAILEHHVRKDQPLDFVGFSAGVSVNILLLPIHRPERMVWFSAYVDHSVGARQILSAYQGEAYLYNGSEDDESSITTGELHTYFGPTKYSEHVTFPGCNHGFTGRWADEFLTRTLRVLRQKPR